MWPTRCCRGGNVDTMRLFWFKPPRPIRVPPRSHCRSHLGSTDLAHTRYYLDSQAVTSISPLTESVSLEANLGEKNDQLTQSHAEVWLMDKWVFSVSRKPLEVCGLLKHLEMLCLSTDNPGKMGCARLREPQPAVEPGLPSRIPISLGSSLVLACQPLFKLTMSFKSSEFDYLVISKLQSWGLVPLFATCSWQELGRREPVNWVTGDAAGLLRRVQFLVCSSPDPGTHIPQLWTLSLSSFFVLGAKGKGFVLEPEALRAVK